MIADSLSWAPRVRAGIALAAFEDQPVGFWVCVALFFAVLSFEAWLLTEEYVAHGYTAYTVQWCFVDLWSVVFRPFVCCE